MSRIGKRQFTNEELIALLQNIYAKYNIPITATILKEDNTMPTFKVFNRAFGSWQNACEKAKVPYGAKKIDIKNGNYHRKTERVGEEKTDKYGCRVKIIEYNNAHDIVIEFQDEYAYRIRTTYGNWTKENFHNPYAKTIFNVGYIGNTCSKINGIKKESYKVWYAMMQRCYKECFDNKPTYLQCYVCEEWKCYENFEKWYDENFYKVKNEQMMLDKDILFKGNLEYCPNKCVFAPQSINKLFTKRQLHRGLYPIGVHYDNRYNSYVASCSNGNRRKSRHLGYYNNPYSAFKAYKRYKEKHIKEVADEYKNEIPSNLYEAMYRYEVEITD